MLTTIVLVAIWLCVCMGLYIGLRARSKACEPKAYPFLIVSSLLAVLIVAAMYRAGTINKPVACQAPPCGELE